MKRFPGRPDSRLKLTARWPDDLLRNILFAVCVHVVCVSAAALISPWTGIRPDLSAAVRIVAGQFDAEHESNGSLVPPGAARAPIDALADYPGAVILYVAIACLVGAGAGATLRTIEDRWRWGARLVAFLRSENETEKYEEWRRWLGEVGAGDSRTESFRLLSAIVELGGNAYIFTGKLLQTHPDPNGDPEWFELTDVYRRRFDDGGQEPHRIGGQGMVLRMCEIKTLHIRDFEMDLDAVDESESDSSADDESAA